MTTLTPTPEQLLIIEHAKTSPANLLVEARAGAAKTSTLVMLANELRAPSGLALAFNKSIQVEMEQRLPSTFECKTMNGLGHQVWGRYLGKRLTLVKSKTYGLVKDAIARFEKKEQDELYEDLGVLLRMCQKTKQVGYVWGLKTGGGVRVRCDEQEYLDGMAEIPTDLQLEVIRLVSAEGYKQARQGVIDFDDQIMMPALCSVSFPFYTHVLVDEAQDLSPLQHVIISKLVRQKTKFIAVGDPCQAIYGFRGADEDSMDKLSELFQMERLFLTTCFRCASNIIEAARWRAPDMNWPSWATEGAVQTLSVWAPEDIPDGSAILCRNNAPLFKTALRLLRAGRYPEVMGRDVLANLAKRMEKLGQKTYTRDQSLQQVDAWLEVEKTKNKDQSLNEDIAECMRVFIEQAYTLGDAVALVKSMAERKGRIKLATGHRAKGLEFPTVFFLDKDLCRPKGQDRNIKYVIQTRAEQQLFYIESDGFTSEHLPEEEVQSA